MAFPFYGADGTSGTVAANNGSKTVTGTGTNWLSNNAIPSAGGYCIKMPDAKIYGIDTCTGEGALALSENYAGSNVSGGSYYIIPTAASNAALLNQVSTLLNSSNFSQIAGLSPNSGDFPEYLSGTWATRSPTQVILNLLNSVGEVSIASASTCDIGAATTPKVQITGTTTITGFGMQASAVRLVRFGGALSLTYNATSLILIGAADRITASGDTGIYVSDSSGHWREWSYCRADGTPLKNPVLPPPPGMLFGMGTSNNSGTPNTKIDIAAGSCADSTNAVTISFGSTNTIDFGTTGANGLDTGSIASSTTYHIFAISKSDGTSAGLASTSLTPTLPSGYSYKRRIFSIYTNSSSHLIAYLQKGGNVVLATAPQDLNTTALGTTAVSSAMSVPSGIKVIAKLRGAMGSSTPGVGILISSLDETTAAVNVAGGYCTAVCPAVGVGAGYSVDVLTNTSKQVRVVASAASTSIFGSTYGWFDDRGIN